MRSKTVAASATVHELTGEAEAAFAAAADLAPGFKSAGGT